MSLAAARTDCFDIESSNDSLRPAKSRFFFPELLSFSAAYEKTIPA
jgi:hypothetical protein